MSKTTVNHSMIGQILQSFGRITEADVEAALQYQRENGGYFGEALLALGLVTREELDWGLASQFDIPYVFPDAGSIDPEAAALVTPEWALANLTLPILKTADTLNVIVDTPIWSDAVEELQGRTNLKIELGLASSAKIRELIREVYEQKRAEPAPPPSGPRTVDQMLEAAFHDGAARCGLSVRGRRATGWIEVDGGTVRVPMDRAWEEALEQVVSPPPSLESAGKNHARWTAEVSLDTTSFPADVHFLRTPAGEEYVFESARSKGRPKRFDRPSPSLLAEIRLLVTSGTGRFVVTSDPPDLADRVVHWLPSMVLDETSRAVAVTDEDVEISDDLFVQRIDGDGGGAVDALEELRTFRFDGASVALAGDPQNWLGAALDVAQTAFVRWSDELDHTLALRANVRWELRVEEQAGDRLEWTLRSFRAER